MIKNFYLADIRRETQIVTIKRGEKATEHNASRADPAEPTSPSLPPSSARVGLRSFRQTLSPRGGAGAGAITTRTNTSNKKKENQQKGV